MACRIPTWDCIILFGMCELWNMTIACALRWGVALVGSLLYWAWLTLYGKHFRCRIDTDGQRSFEAVIVNKADMWPCYHFVKYFEKNLILMCNICKSVVIKLL